PGRRAVGYFVQPVAERLRPLKGTGLLNQDEEGCLEGVLRVVLIPQHTATDAKDQRAVAAEDRLEGALVMPGGGAFEQLAVCSVLGTVQVDRRTQVVEDGFESSSRHRFPFAAAAQLPYPYQHGPP